MTQQTIPMPPPLHAASIADMGLPHQNLLAHYSLEITAKERPALPALKNLVMPGTQVSVTFLPGEQDAARLHAAAAIRSQGLTPVPHLAARRVASAGALRDYLANLQQMAGIDRAFVIAGDPPVPVGPYDSALALIRTGMLAEYGILRVGIGGYPDGHPRIPDDVLWQALHAKHKLLTSLGHEYEIVTQFGFQPEPILAWLERLRQEGITATVRIGLAGPVGVHKLLRYAASCGVGASASILRKYGVSISRLLDTAGPEQLLESLRTTLDPARHGRVLLHFFPFGDMEKTVRWIHQQPPALITTP